MRNQDPWTIRQFLPAKPRGKPPFTRYVMARGDPKGIPRGEPYEAAKGPPSERGDPGG